MLQKMGNTIRARESYKCEIDIEFDNASQKREKKREREELHADVGSCLYIYISCEKKLS